MSPVFLNSVSLIKQWPNFNAQNTPTTRDTSRIQPDSFDTDQTTPEIRLIPAYIQNSKTRKQSCMPVQQHDILGVGSQASRD